MTIYTQAKVYDSEDCNCIQDCDGINVATFDSAERIDPEEFCGNSLVFMIAVRM